MPFLPPNQQRQSTEGKQLQSYDYSQWAMGSAESMQKLNKHVTRTTETTQTADFAPGAATCRVTLSKRHFPVAWTLREIMMP